MPSQKKSKTAKRKATSSPIGLASGTGNSGILGSCMICDTQIDSGDRLFQCEGCFKNTHLGCTGVDPDLENDILAGILHAIHIVGYRCHPCKKTAVDAQCGLQELVRQQGVQLNELKAALHNLSGANIHPATNDQPIVKSVTDRVLAQVMKEVNEKDRRRRNVMITGLRETGSAVDDVTLFRKFCSDHMNFTPECEPNKTRRIGSQTGDLPRRMIITLTSEASRSALLMRAPLLRNVQQENIGKSIFIGPDLTKTESDAAYHRRQLVKERRAKNNTAPVRSITASTSLYHGASAASNVNLGKYSLATSGVAVYTSASSSVTTHSSSGDNNYAQMNPSDTYIFPSLPSHNGKTMLPPAPVAASNPLHNAPTTGYPLRPTQLVSIDEGSQGQLASGGLVSGQSHTAVIDGTQGAAYPGSSSDSSSCMARP